MKYDYCVQKSIQYIHLLLSTLKYSECSGTVTPTTEDGEMWIFYYKFTGHSKQDLNKWYDKSTPIKYICTYVGIEVADLKVYKM